jgi:Zc3h12a-like Ribonuclease NYN domain
MIAPVFLFVLSLALGLLAFQPGLSDLALLALPSALASLYLLFRAWSDLPPIRPGVRRPARRPLRSPVRPPNWIVVDGSNVMHWQDNTPRLSAVRAVLDRLTALGFSPGVVFDANAGYKIGDRYQHDGALARMLGLPADRVLVAGKGTQADPLLLAAARDLKARIVTNDRFRDWAETHPEVTEPGHLIRGGFRDGKLWLDLEGAGLDPDKG